MRRSLRVLLVSMTASPACVFDGDLLVPEAGGGGGAGPATTSLTVASTSSASSGVTAASTGGAGGGGGEAVEPYFDCDLSGPVVAEELDSWQAGTCARSSDGRVYCWGSDSWGQLGRGFYDTMNSHPDPLEITLPGPAYQVEIYYAGCAIIGDCYEPELYCWGRNGEGQAGQLPAQSVEVLAPTKVTLPGAVVDVATGWSHTCAIVVVDKEPQVYCWGKSYNGQCGVATVEALPPTRVELGDGEVPVDIFAGDATTCVRVEVGGAADGTRCWGSNANAILGTIGPDSPDPAPHPSLAGDVGVEMDHGDSGCAFTSTHAGCWGANDQGQLNGVPDAGAHPEPELFELPDTVSMSISPFGALARLSDGTWHAIGDGKLEPGTDPEPSPFTTFKRIGALDDFNAVAASGNYCGIDPMGEIYCWGNPTNFRGCMGPSFTAGAALHHVPLP